MSEWKIYFNPNCSKCREALGLLRKNGIEPTVVEFLKSPPTVVELQGLVKTLKVETRDLVRTQEAIFKDLHLDLSDEESVLKAITIHPILLVRPIVLNGRRGVIARPPETLLSLLSGDPK